MAMSKTDFKNAFREVISRQFLHIPADENSIEFTFSERFNKRMAKLIKAQRKAYYSFINTAYKRVAIICIIIFTMFTAACSVKEIREPIVNFIKQVYETFIHYSFDGDTTEVITKEYNITQIPDGFKEIGKIKTDSSIITTYENASGDIIEFFQQATYNNSGLFLDNENTTIRKEIVNGIEVETQEWYDTKSAIWTYDGYFFMIDCSGNIDFDTIKQLISSIE